MQIIIPMTGYGSRFIAAGYKELKPFIKVHGKTMIEWIVQGMYSIDDSFIFVVRQDHLIQYPWIKNYLLNLSSKTQIFSVVDWGKKGPVFDVLKASNIIDDEAPAIINYCDFYMTWNWKNVKESIINQGCEGCIPTYTGFHPHLLIEKNVYASCLKNKNDDLVEIREKYSFEFDKMKAHHSPGVYYFKTGKLLKKYCQLLIDSNESINGEFYASLPYNRMVKDGLRVWIYDCVDQFCQWGTPEDLSDFNFWTETILRSKK